MHRVVAAAAALLLGLLLASPAQAAKPGGSGAFAWTLQGFGYQLQSPVEQQTDYPYPADTAEWVLNPFPDCYWDVDDEWQHLGAGSLAAGASVALEECFVSDADSYMRTVNGTTASYSTPRKYLAVYVESSSPDLEVSVCYRPQGRCFTLRPAAADRTWTYQSCTQVGYTQGDPALVEVSGSQGGTGVVTDVTVTVTNPTSRKATASSAASPSTRTAGTPDQGCRDHSSQIVAEYPYRYYVS